ncbi:MAG TPA: hypothetical protein O0X72_04000, partial [Methanocorpusculum sp.]|nr:hypothetical protein [Methanocorpusculum sp.]
SCRTAVNNFFLFPQAVLGSAVTFILLAGIQKKKSFVYIRLFCPWKNAVTLLSLKQDRSVQCLMDMCAAESLPPSSDLQKRIKLFFIGIEHDTYTSYN